MLNTIFAEFGENAYALFVDPSKADVTSQYLQSKFVIYTRSLVTFNGYIRFTLSRLTGEFITTFTNKFTLTKSVSFASDTKTSTTNSAAPVLKSKSTSVKFNPTYTVIDTFTIEPKVIPTETAEPITEIAITETAEPITEIAITETETPVEVEACPYHMTHAGSSEYWFAVPVEEEREIMNWLNDNQVHYCLLHHEKYEESDSTTIIILQYNVVEVVREVVDRYIPSFHRYLDNM